MKRAAICRYGGVGDILMAVSVAPALKRHYDTVDILACTPHGSLAENNPDIDRITYPNMGKLPDGVAWQHWHDARSDEYDLFVNLSHSCETMGAFHEAQTQFWWPSAARRRIANRNYLELVHDACGMPYDDIGKPLFYPTEHEQETAAATVKKITDGKWIALALAGSRRDKVYPFMPMLVARLVREVAPVVLFGGSGQEVLMAETIQEHVKQQNGTDRGLHVAISPDPKVYADWYKERGLDPAKGGNWTLRRALSTVHQANVVIGPDTGTMWAVAFEPMPKIMLLSHASPENIVKRWRNTTTFHADQAKVDCWPCHRLQNRVETCRANAQNNGAACISDIGVEEIMNATMIALLDRDGASLGIHDDKIGVIRGDAAANGLDPNPPHALYIGHADKGVTAT